MQRPRWLGYIWSFCNDFPLPLAGISASIVVTSVLLRFQWRRLLASSGNEDTGLDLPLKEAEKSTPPSASDPNSEEVKVLGQSDSIYVKQPYDAFLVLDVEATCLQGTNFQWPNEIIEWPVCLMRWKDKRPDGTANTLEIVAEFRSFVRPIWRPTLTQFCTDLTGIGQTQVDKAPVFPDVVASFSKFLSNHGLIDPVTGERLVRFCWCSDGPFDVRDFVIKQCFISKIPMPEWIKGDVMDVRRIVSHMVHRAGRKSRGSSSHKSSSFARRPSLNLTSQLRFLNLAPFIGRQHSGIDDTRNIARIVAELARRGVRLETNTRIHADRRWAWMGKPGEILEEYVT